MRCVRQTARRGTRCSRAACYFGLCQQHWRCAMGKDLPLLQGQRAEAQAAVATVCGHPASIVVGYLGFSMAECQQLIKQLMACVGPPHNTSLPEGLSDAALALWQFLTTEGTAFLGRHPRFRAAVANKMLEMRTYPFQRDRRARLARFETCFVAFEALFPAPDAAPATASAQPPKPICAAVPPS